MRTAILNHGATLFVLALLGLAMLVGSAALRVGAADHLDAPTVKSDHRIDINDVYVFQGANPANTVLVMTTNVHAGFLSGTTFRAGALYEFKIDNTGDAIEDVAYRIKFGDVRGDGSQQIHIQRADGAGNPATGGGGQQVAKGSTGQMLSVAGGGTAWAGLADDPFYFDLVGFSAFKSAALAAVGGGLTGAELAGALANICATNPAPNFFAGFDATAIVLEVPDAALDGNNASGMINVWGETAIVEGDVLTQVERMGLPTINTVFNHSDPTKEAYNRANPSGDAALVGGNISFLVSAIVGAAEQLGAYGGAVDEAAYGAVIAGALTPDVLTYDTDTTADFTALNGRGLNDDVINVAYSAVSM
ncbi:MAG: DUF4331 family protein, partial [Candidatus Limnocylindria bacterium]